MGKSTLVLAIPLFLVAAIFGLTMAIYIFKRRLPPFYLVIAHGAFVIEALGLALWSIGMADTPSVVAYGVVVLVVGALVGVVLISFQFRDELQPRILVVVHGVAAVSGVSCLLAGLLQLSRLERAGQWIARAGGLH